MVNFQRDSIRLHAGEFGLAYCVIQRPLQCDENVLDLETGWHGVSQQNQVTLASDEALRY